MKRHFIILGFLLYPFLWMSPLDAAQIAAEGTPVRKLQRGFLNIALSPIEISNELAKEKKVESAIPSWFFTGLGRGGAFMVGRALAGVYDMVTAPFPLPSGYAPLVYPEFAWEHFGEENSKS
jgi:putative exosortase-associated protein (TIGR04073 family)